MWLISLSTEHKHCNYFTCITVSRYTVQKVYIGYGSKCCCRDMNFNKMYCIKILKVIGKNKSNFCECVLIYSILANSYFANLNLIRIMLPITKADICNNVHYLYNYLVFSIFAHQGVI